MLEAIGESLFETYFATIDRVLAPGGRACIQTIAVPDQRYAAYRRTRDFIQAHIFPGGHLPSVEVMARAMRRASRLHVHGLEEIGPHYATTLAHWRQNLRANLARVRSLGYGEEFIRMWEYYFCYCEGGFMERVIGDVQMLLVKPGNRRMPV